MKRSKKLIGIYLVLVALFSAVFSLGVFANPNFNIHDFCMNLASEIIGIVIALVLIDTYVKEKNKTGEDASKK